MGTLSVLVRSAQMTRLARRGGLSEPNGYPFAFPHHKQPVSCLLAWGLETLSVGALLDSGADECLIDVTLARQAGIPLEPMDTTLSAQALDGHLLGKISHRTIPLSLTISTR